MRQPHGGVNLAAVAVPLAYQGLVVLKGVDEQVHVLQGQGEVVVHELRNAAHSGRGLCRLRHAALENRLVLSQSLGYLCHGYRPPSVICSTNACTRVRVCPGVAKIYSVSKSRQARFFFSASVSNIMRS